MIDQLSSFIGSELSNALGWTIIHSLWQVSLLALIMSAIHKVYQQRSSVFKYNVSLMSMVLSLVVSIVTFMVYYVDWTPTAIAEDTAVSIVTHANSTQVSATIIENMNSLFSNNIHHINTIWIIGILLFIVKFFVSYGYIKYIKSTAVDYVDHTIQNLLLEVKNNIGIQKNIRVVESSKISVPMVIGFLKPIILFPFGMINMLTPQEVEAIIAHELFHVKRNDYIVNMVLTIVEIAYFFHPAMWWISANIKAERENCCDDAAINYNIDSVTYAKALVKLEEMRKAGIPALAMPFASNKHQLLNRIKRILNMEQTKNDIREKSVATVLLLSIAILFSSNVGSQTLRQETKTITAEEEITLEVKDGKVSSFIVDGEEQSAEHKEDIQSVINASFPEELLKEGSTHSSKIYGNPSLNIEIDKLILEGSQSRAELPTAWLGQNGYNPVFLSTRELDSEISDHLVRTGDSIIIDATDDIIYKVTNGEIKIIVDGKEYNTDRLSSILKNNNGEILKDQTLTMKGSPTMKINTNGTLSFFSDSLTFEDSSLNLSQSSLLLDTLPNQRHKGNGHFTIINENNGKKIELTKEKGEIKKLIIDGKTIPPSEYDKYSKEIESATEGINFDFDFNDRFEDFDFQMKNMDSTLSKSFGMLFDGENWREFGGNMERFLDNDIFEKMEEMENFRMLDLKELQNLDGLIDLKNLKELKGLKQLENLEDLGEIFEDMGIKLDSSMMMYNFDIENLDRFKGFDGLENFKGFDGFQFFDDDNIEIREPKNPFGSNTVVDKIGNALNRDGLLEEYKNNKIELSGKHLKINGEKMPKVLFNKYKNIYQEATGAPLTKKSKLVFDIEGKPSKRKIRAF